MRSRLLAILVFFSFLQIHATHNRSGYISYCYVGGGVYKLRVYTYTSISAISIQADRCEQTVYISDKYGHLLDSVVCPRVNNLNAPCPNTQTGHDGVVLIPATSGYGGVKENIYEGDTPPLNPSTYVLSMIDPNRDAGIINLGGQSSSNIVFALGDTLIAYSGIAGVGTNCTPTFTNRPIQNACVGQPWCYNPGAQDPEHDSLTYSLTKSFEDDPNNRPGGIEPIGIESIPAGMSVDKYGTLCWYTPPQQGEFNIAMLIREYRKNPLDGHWYEVGVTIFDIQILVGPCPQNSITFNNPPRDTCIVAGTTYSVLVTASGSGITPPMNMSATGIPFTSNTIGPKATLSNNGSSGNTVTDTLKWTPGCQAVQASSYQITLQAYDSNQPLANANYATYNIHVVSPPPISLSANVFSDSIQLHWSPPPSCNQTSGNSIVKYLIYRADGCPSFVPSACQTGAPSGFGYTLVGTTTSSVTVFTDINSGFGFPPGNTYSYIVVAEFADGAFSIASANICVTTKLNVPLLMKVSVDTTDASVGKMNVWWNKPLVNQGNFDTTVYPGPYKFEVYKKPAGGTYPTTPIYTITHVNYAQIGAINSMIDTTSNDSIDTRDTMYYYKVGFYYTDPSSHQFVFIGNSSQGSSIYLTATPMDKRAILSWSVSVPWTNDKYYILQQGQGGASDNYTIVDSTTATRDTIYDLTNGKNFCFKVLSKGEYANPLIQKYIWNYSEKVCVTPIDREAPCQPQLNVLGNCSTSVNKLVWTNPNHTCGIDDVVKYYIYYASFRDSTLTLIDSLFGANDTTYTTDYSASIAGCYVIVAIDSVGNRSPLANEMCTDNCPEYELPNIFTPNGDNLNDLYIPVKNKFIKDVEFTLYNRWGQVIFETTDPALNWDGKSKQMKQPVSDGTYYYVCKVHELHYYGIKDKDLKGFIQVLH